MNSSGPLYGETRSVQHKYGTHYEVTFRCSDDYRLLLEPAPHHGPWWSKWPSVGATNLADVFDKHRMPLLAYDDYASCGAVVLLYVEQDRTAICYVPYDPVYFGIRVVLVMVKGGDYRYQFDPLCEEMFDLPLATWLTSLPIPISHLRHSFAADDPAEHDYADVATWLATSPDNMTAVMDALKNISIEAEFVDVRPLVNKTVVKTKHDINEVRREQLDQEFKEELTAACLNKTSMDVPLTLIRKELDATCPRFQDEPDVVRQFVNQVEMVRDYLSRFDEQLMLTQQPNNKAAEVTLAKLTLDTAEVVDHMIENLHVGSSILLNFLMRYMKNYLIESALHYLHQTYAFYGNQPSSNEPLIYNLSEITHFPALSKQLDVFNKHKKVDIKNASEEKLALYKDVTDLSSDALYSKWTPTKLEQFANYHSSVHETATMVPSDCLLNKVVTKLESESADEWYVHSTEPVLMRGNYSIKDLQSGVDMVTGGEYDRNTTFKLILGGRIERYMLQKTYWNWNQQAECGLLENICRLANWFCRQDEVAQLDPANEWVLMPYHPNMIPLEHNYHHIMNSPEAVSSFVSDLENFRMASLEQVQSPYWLGEPENLPSCAWLPSPSYHLIQMHAIKPWQNCVFKPYTEALKKVQAAVAIYYKTIDDCLASTKNMPMSTAYKTVTKSFAKGGSPDDIWWFMVDGPLAQRMPDQFKAFRAIPVEYRRIVVNQVMSQWNVLPELGFTDANTQVWIASVGKCITNAVFKREEKRLIKDHHRQLARTVRDMQAEWEEEMDSRDRSQYDLTSYVMKRQNGCKLSISAKTFRTDIHPILYETLGMLARGRGLTELAVSIPSWIMKGMCMWLVCDPVSTNFGHTVCFEDAFSTEHIPPIAAYHALLVWHIIDRLGGFGGVLSECGAYISSGEIETSIADYIGQHIIDDVRVYATLKEGIETRAVPGLPSTVLEKANLYEQMRVLVHGEVMMGDQGAPQDNLPTMLSLLSHHMKSAFSNNGNPPITVPLIVAALTGELWSEAWLLQTWVDNQREAWREAAANIMVNVRGEEVEFSPLATQIYGFDSLLQNQPSLRELLAIPGELMCEFTRPEDYITTLSPHMLAWIQDEFNDMGDVVAQEATGDDYGTCRPVKVTRDELIYSTEPESSLELEYDTAEELLRMGLSLPSFDQHFDSLTPSGSPTPSNSSDEECSGNESSSVYESDSDSDNECISLPIKHQIRISLRSNHPVRHMGALKQFRELVNKE